MSFSIKKFNETLISKGIDLSTVEIEKVNHSKNKVLYPNGDLGTWLYYTEVVKEHSDGITLNTDGFMTRTSKATINSALPEGMFIKAENGNWFVHYGEKKTPYHDMMILPVTQ